MVPSLKNQVSFNAKSWSGSFIKGLFGGGFVKQATWVPVDLKVWMKAWKNELIHKVKETVKSQWVPRRMVGTQNSKNSLLARRWHPEATTWGSNVCFCFFLSHGPWGWDGSQWWKGNPYCDFLFLDTFFSAQFITMMKIVIITKFRKHLLNAYYVPGTVLGARNHSYMTDKVPDLTEFTFS